MNAETCRLPRHRVYRLCAGATCGLITVMLAAFTITVACPPPPVVAADLGGNDAYQSISNPAYQHRVKHFARLENSIRGLLVTDMSNGRLAGNSEEIIATVDPAKHSPRINFINNVGEDVQVATRIAYRAIKLRYPEIQPGRINFSFADQYDAVDGNSASCACAVLMLSLLENTHLDRTMAITGAITADWRVRAVGGLEAKIHGAITDHLTGVVVPQSNGRNVCDVMLLDGPQTAWRIQIFSVRTLQQAMAMMRRNKPRDISYAMLLFETLQKKFDRNGLGALHDPATIERLKQITSLAPNDLSAQYLLELAAGKQPKRLSIGATMYEAFAAIQFYSAYLWDDPPPNAPLLGSPIRDSLRRLNKLSEIGSLRCLPLVETLRRFVRTCGNWAGTPNGPIHIARRHNQVMAELDRLNGNKEDIDRMMRSGF